MSTAVASRVEKHPPSVKIPKGTYQLALLASGLEGKDSGRLWTGHARKLRLFLNATGSTQAAELKGVMVSIPSRTLHAFWDGRPVGIASSEEAFFHKNPTDFERFARLFLEQLHLSKLIEQSSSE